MPYVKGVRRHAIFSGYTSIFLAKAESSFAGSGSLLVFVIVVVQGIPLDSGIPGTAVYVYNVTPNFLQNGAIAFVNVS